MPSLLTPGYFPCHLYANFRADKPYITLPLKDAMSIYWKQKSVTINYNYSEFFKHDTCPPGQGPCCFPEYSGTFSVEYISDLWSQSYKDDIDDCAPALYPTYFKPLPDETYLPCWTKYRCSAMGIGQAHRTGIGGVCSPVPCEDFGTPTCTGRDCCQKIYDETSQEVLVRFNMFELNSCIDNPFDPGSGIKERIDLETNQIVVDINVGLGGVNAALACYGNDSCFENGTATIFGQTLPIYSSYGNPADYSGYNTIANQVSFSIDTNGDEWGFN